MGQQDQIESRTIGDYLDALASSEPAPGGGSVAGLVGALAVGLGAMVVSLTRDASQELIDAGRRLDALRSSMIASGAADERAYAGFVRATKMPKSTDEEKANRRHAMQQALQEAAAVPMQLAETGVELLREMKCIVAHGSKHVLSDAAIAVILASACVDTSLINVRVNLPMIKDPELRNRLTDHAITLEQQAHELAESLRSMLDDRNT